MKRRVWSAALVVTLALATPSLAGAATFTVTASDDADDGACTPSHCSLREALNAANAAPGQDVVAFDVGGGGLQTIAPLSPLPEATDPVVLDATTQPGFAGSPLIEIDGTSAGGNGLVLLGGDSIIRGFVLNRFGSSYAAVYVGGADGNRIEGNYVGTDPTGTVASANHIGVEIESSDGNVVGGTTPAVRNVLSGNEAGIVVAGEPTAGSLALGNLVQGNYIGLDSSGSQALRNVTGIVIVTGAEHTVVGGLVPGARNVVSGNDLGMSVQGDSTTVQGNYVGTDRTGTAAVGNIFGIQVIPDLATNTGGTNALIGGSEAGAGNVISGNTRGIELQFASFDRVQGNLIGTAADGGAPLGNVEGGILIDRSSDNLVGGTSPGEGNVIANSLTRYGIEIIEGPRNAILGDTFYGNPGSMRLVPYDPSDPGDVDGGANDGQNYPVVGPATGGGGSMTVAGTLDSHASTTYRIEFFDCESFDAFEREAFLDVRDVTTNASGSATFSFTLPAEAGYVSATATDPDGNTSQFSGCVQVQPTPPAAAVTLSPRTGVGDVGTTHTVTAQAVSVAEAQPLAGVAVRFAVQGSVTTTGSCITDANGRCGFTYAGPSVPGSDLIAAYPDRNGNGIQDATEIGDSVTESWVAVATTPGQVTGGGQTSNFGGTDLLAFGFTAQSDGTTAKGACSVQDRASGTSIKCQDVTSLAVTGTHAVIRGSATINGVGTTYRIEVDDLGEPGAGRDAFTITTATGYAAGGVLEKGNVQIHA